MSVETTLLINAKYTAEDVVKVLKSIGMKIGKESVKGTHFSTYCLINFRTPSNNHRTLHVHRSQSALGPVLMLRFGSNPEGHAILKEIGECLGGFFQEDDCSNGEWIEFQGLMTEENGLPYFIKQMIMEGKGSEYDMNALKKYIEQWEKDVGSPSNVITE